MVTLTKHLNYAGFQQSEVENVCRVIAHTNPHCRGIHWMDIARHMMDTARSSLKPDEPSYVATRGWCVSSYWYSFGEGDDAREMRYKATVEAWGILQTIKM